MAFNTGNPVPSTDAKDLSDNAENFDGAVNLQSDTWVDRLAVTRDTVNGRIKKMGFTVPVAYASGISFATNDNVKTVEEVGVVYAPLPSALPFTTTNFAADAAKFFVVQGVNSDLSVPYIFDTVAAYKSFPTAFPVGKVIQLKDRGAEFNVIAGTGTANTFNIIASSTVSQSIDLIVLDNVNVRQWGAKAQFASLTDDKAVFESAAAYCIANNRVMFVPKSNDDYYISGDLDLWGVHQIQFDGFIRLPAATNTVTFGGNTLSAPSMSIDLLGVSGIARVYGMNRGEFNIQFANTLYLFASDAIAGRNTVSYCRFSFVNVDTVHLECQDTAGGIPFINENKFYCGRTRVNFLMDGTYPMNNNIFYGLCMESLNINIEAGQNNYFHDVRLEGTNTFNFGPTTFNNLFWQTWSNFANTLIWDLPASTYNVTDAGDNNRIVPVHYFYTEKDVILDINRENLGDGVAFIVSPTNPDKIQITQNAFPICNTGLIRVTDKLWFTLIGDVASFFIRMYVYNEDGIAITTEPGAGFKDSQGGTVWNAAGYWEYASPVLGGSYAVNPLRDLNVKYVRFEAITDNGASGDEHTSIVGKLVQTQENKVSVKNIISDVSRIDVISNRVTAVSESTATDIFRFTSNPFTTADATGCLAGRLDIAVSAQKGSAEDAASFSLDVLITREAAGNLTITAGTPSLLSNGSAAAFEIDGITIATKAGASPSEAIMTIAISTTQADPFVSLNARARLTGIADYSIFGAYIIAASKI